MAKRSNFTSVAPDASAPEVGLTPNQPEAVENAPAIETLPAETEQAPPIETQSVEVGAPPVEDSARRAEPPKAEPPSEPPTEIDQINARLAELGDVLAWRDEPIREVEAQKELFAKYDRLHTERVIALRMEHRNRSEKAQHELLPEVHRLKARLAQLGVPVTP